MIGINNNVKLANGIVSIEKDYLSFFSQGFVIDYEHLYKDQFDERISQLCSSLHYQLIEMLRILNDSITGRGHFWAEPSRNLIKAISLSNRLVNNFKNVGENVHFVVYYDNVLKKCENFLSSSGGSVVPDDMEEIEIYYELPIFEASDSIQLSNDKTQKFQLNPIGNGSYADVFSYYDSNYDNYFALKRAKQTITPKDLERFKREFQITKKLSSPYIIKVYRYDDLKNEFTMELADDSLLNYIQKNNSKLTFMERRQLCLQVIKIFSYLEEKDILHRDISPNNFLIKNYDDVTVVKIADFGLVKPPESQLTSLNTEVRGCFNDMVGLDRVGFENYNRQFEYFALAKLIYFILTGRYSNMNKFELPGLKDLFDKGTNPDFKKRYKSIKEFTAYFIRISERN